MNNNESLNMSRGSSSDLSDSDTAGMTAEELELYREVLEAAYPQPGRDIKAGVMSAVRRDAAMKKKRASYRSMIMKWGTMAASIALIAAVSIRVLPSFLSVEKDAAYDGAYESIITQTMDTAASESYQMTTRGGNPPEAESPAETAAEKKNAGPALFASTMSPQTDPSTKAHSNTDEDADAVPAEEAVIEEAADEIVTAEVCVEEIVEDAAAYNDSAEEAPAAMLMAVSEEGAAEEEKALTITSECTHTGVFGNSYHTIPEELIAEVGEGEYLAWTEEVKSPADPCTVSIRSFIEHFEIPEEIMTMYLITTDMAYFYDYPVDILYGDAQECEEYYAGGGRYTAMIADNFEYTLKSVLKDEIPADEYEAWLADFAYPTIRAWSISEFVRDHDIPEYRFLEIYNETADDYKAEHGVEELHSYNTPKLYVSAAGIHMAIAVSSVGYQADISCRQ